MATGIFTLRNQLLGLIQKAWTGTQKTNFVEYLVVGGGGSGGGGTFYGSGGGGFQGQAAGGGGYSGGGSGAFLSACSCGTGAGGGLGGALGIASSFGIDLGGGGGGGAFAAGNLAELMKSRLLVEKVLLVPIQINNKTISLAEYYIQINNLREGWDKNPNLKNIQFLPNDDKSYFTFQHDSILKIIYRNLIDATKLSIQQKDKKITILSIEVTSENENFSKFFCENLAKETSDFYIETKSKKARINVSVLQRQADSVRNALNSAISIMANETDYIYNLNPAFNIKGAPSKKKQIDVQSNTAILSNLVVQLELAKIALRKETPLIQLIDRPILPLDKEKFGKLKSIILGGFLSGFLTLLYLIFSQLFKKLYS
jgi:hypothetical protein